MTTAVATTPKDLLKTAAREACVPVKDLLVLSPQNDPFNCGSDKDIAQGQWFARLFQEQGFEPGVHVRRIFYRLITLSETIYQHDDKTPFHNTKSCWNYLQEASRKARYLGLVDPQAFSDQRNPDPVLYAAEPVDPDDPGWQVDDFEGWWLPEINTDLRVQLDLPDIYVDGYEYDPGEQPYLLEVWIEKSTMNDVLDPICREYRANLVTGVGFQSITSVVNLLNRCSHLFAMGRPVRVFYVSDHDPAGQCMPVQTARQLQFWLQRFGLEGDIKLKHLALTGEQIERYDLPRKPIDDGNKAKGDFESRNGEGATELDAMEAIYPGELGRIVEEALSPYRDELLQRRLKQADYEASCAATDEWRCATSDIRENVERLRRDAQAVVDKYVPRLEALRDEMNEELSPIRDRMETLEKEATAAAGEAEFDLQVDLPVRPKSDIDPPDESDWLYDSIRLDGMQLEFYRAHKNGGNA